MTTTTDRGVAGSAVIAHLPQQLRASQGVRGSNLEVDLCGVDYYERRRRLFTALRALRPGQVLRLRSDRDDDMYWLRYEAEVRMSQRHCWSLPSGVPGAVETTVRCPSHVR